MLGSVVDQKFKNEYNSYTKTGPSTYTNQSRFDFGSGGRSDYGGVKHRVSCVAGAALVAVASLFDAFASIPLGLATAATLTLNDSCFGRFKAAVYSGGQIVSRPLSLLLGALNPDVLRVTEGSRGLGWIGNKTNSPSQRLEREVRLNWQKNSFFEKQIKSRAQMVLALVARVFERLGDLIVGFGAVPLAIITFGQFTPLTKTAVRCAEFPSILADIAVMGAAVINPSRVDPVPNWIKVD